MDHSDTESKRKMITVRGLSGLRNLGNTCYMNAVLQCLMATNVFSMYLRGHHFVDDLRTGITEMLADEKRKEEGLEKDAQVTLKKGAIKRRFKDSVTYRLYQVFANMWSFNCVLAPRKFKDIVGKYSTIFNGYSQNDSQELLIFLLNRIHDETKTDVKNIQFHNVPDSVVAYQKKKKEVETALATKNLPMDLQIKLIDDFNKYMEEHVTEVAIDKSLRYWEKEIKGNHSRITDIFTGLYLNETECNNCKKKSFTFEPFNMIHLPLPEFNFSGTTLADCFNDLIKPEMLSGDNKYSCDNCKQKTDAVKRLYIWSTPEYLIIHLKRFKNIGMRTMKINTFIDYPINNMSLTNNMASYVKKDVLYDLYGVVHHSGNMNGGHYISYTQNAINNLWYEYNDNTCLHIPPKDVENEVVNNGAYILFYKKQRSKISEFDDDKSVGSSDTEIDPKNL